MTDAQRQAIYGDSPNGPKTTSNVSQQQAEAKQRQLAREKQHQDALNSDTVAIDFARGGTSSGVSNVLAANASAPEMASGEDTAPLAASSEAGSGTLRTLRAAILLQDQNSGQPVSAALQRSNPKRKTR